MTRSRELIELTTRPYAWRELASRQSGGIFVGLYWRPRGNGIFVYVKDEHTGESFVLEPPRDAALASFYHPYATGERLPV